MVAEPFPGADTIGGAAMQDKKPPKWAMENLRAINHASEIRAAWWKGWLAGAWFVFVVASLMKLALLLN